MDEYDQKGLWEKKYSEREIHPVNEFAKRCFEKIKDRGYKTLLDLGCGKCEDTLFFASKGFQVTAVDFSEVAIKVMTKEAEKRNLGIRFVNKRFEDLDFRDNSFDVIYAHLSLHYFDDETTKSIFDKLRGILKPGGRIFVQVKSKKDAYYGLGERISRDTFLNKGHVRHFFDTDFMRKNLERFETIEIKETPGTYRDYESRFIEAIATKRNPKEPNEQGDG